MNNAKEQNVIQILQKRFLSMTFPRCPLSKSIPTSIVYDWPGKKDEDVIICTPVFERREPFHRHNFFYFNFTLKGQYDCESHKNNEKITVKEGELYAGQPRAAHAMLETGNPLENVIIGLLIKKNVFFRDFLPLLSDTNLFRFFLEPQTNSVSSDFLYFKLKNEEPARTLLFMMATEYCLPQKDTQAILKSLALSFLLQISRQLTLAKENKGVLQQRLSDKIIAFMASSICNITLGDIAKKFSYHPNYISYVLHKQTRRTFSRILFDLRMQQAEILMNNSKLSIQEIALMVGYNGTSNFYKAFNKKFGKSPGQIRN